MSSTGGSSDSLKKSGKIKIQWPSHHENLVDHFRELYAQESGLDCTFATPDGQLIKAHKYIISACSPFLAQLLKLGESTPNSHPIVVLPNVSHKDLKLLVNFMYRGSAITAQSNLEELLQVATTLQIKGFSTFDNKTPTTNNVAQSSSSSSPSKKSSIVPKKSAPPKNHPNPRFEKKEVVSIPVAPPPPPMPITGALNVPPLPSKRPSTSIKPAAIIQNPISSLAKLKNNPNNPQISIRTSNSNSGGPPPLKRRMLAPPPPSEKPPQLSPPIPPPSPPVPRPLGPPPTLMMEPSGSQAGFTSFNGFKRTGVDSLLPPAPPRASSLPLSASPMPNPIHRSISGGATASKVVKRKSAFIAPERDSGPTRASTPPPDSLEPAPSGVSDLIATGLIKTEPAATIEYRCDSCLKTFQYRNWLRYHQKNKNECPAPPKFHCKCGIYFRQEETYLNHKQGCPEYSSGSNSSTGGRRGRSSGGPKPSTPGSSKSSSIPEHFKFN